MKQGIHPEVRDVVFQDLSCDFAILTKSTMKTKDTITWKDGKEYPVFKTDISSQSHPFYTGKQRVADAEGRAERFKRKYGRSK
ncbi:MAG: type B 50S ribosomal protein L31 [Bdellovibrionales bacterium]|nr:type B 50S ribosomal protein L31 [Bdellovibrionales bacterium]